VSLGSLHGYVITIETLYICSFSGSKQNWRSLSRAFAAKLGMPVYALVSSQPHRFRRHNLTSIDSPLLSRHLQDLRNHGHSPHKRPHDYSHMAADLAKFFADNGLTEGVNLMGHSM
jgi:pimeloyl-ACP methyl ester carboxylesterase